MNSHAQYLDTEMNGASTARILVVEESQTIRRIFTSVLSQFGYEVETAVDGVDALERIATESFDLVVCDRETEKIDGVTLVLALRTCDLRTPVIIVSDSLAQRPIPAGIQKELAGMLQKPVFPGDLLTAIAVALRRVRPRELCAA